MFEHRVKIHTETDMLRLGQGVSDICTGIETLALMGDIGAGKSVFSRGCIANLLPQPEDIPSPTFTIIQQYNGIDFDILHCDLYRLSDISETDELGLWDAMGQALCLIEWPEILEHHLPQDSLRITITPHKDDTRTVTFSGPAPIWRDKIEHICNAI
ncbi:MAG: tRNA (adenosine(37)-N6)-threonylcarbamoyltransferase complex ATPase subunit type 1 TsaE [Pseudomonadota bacterium]